MAFINVGPVKRNLFKLSTTLRSASTTVAISTLCCWTSQRRFDKVPHHHLAPKLNHYGMVWYGMVWYGMVWYGMVWYGMVWYGMVWYGMVWYGMVWYGMVWYGMVWYGMVWYGMVWYGMVCDGIRWNAYKAF